MLANKDRILHEIGGLLNATNLTFNANPISADALASLLTEIEGERITRPSAKSVLLRVFHGDQRRVQEVIKQDRLEILQVDEEMLSMTAQQLVDQHPDVAQKARSGQKPKFDWFVGQLIRQFQGKLDPRKATAALKPFLDH